MSDDDYMCPFCVTPWKCNGPHIPEDDLPALRDWEDDIRADERRKIARRIESFGETTHVDGTLTLTVALAAALARGDTS